MNSHKFKQGDVVQLKVPSSEEKKAKAVDAQLFIRALEYIDAIIASKESCSERYFLIKEGYEDWSRFAGFPLSPCSDRTGQESATRRVEAAEIGLMAEYGVAPIEVVIEESWIEKKVGTISPNRLRELTE